jgi:carboxymethylenebutenolidase
MPDLTFHPVPSRELGGYLAQPLGVGPWPGVVVVMDLFGLSDDIRQIADRFAAAGYVAFAPDLYSGRGLRCVVATMKSSRAGGGEAFDDLDGARRWLSERPDCTGRIGIIGFCMGGAFALLCAPRYDFAAASVNYGEVPKDTSKLAGACPVVASYGRRDRSLKGAAARLETALMELNVPHDVKEYPDAGHSFLNRINGGPGLRPLMRVMAMDYHHPSAEDAWRRILTFFAEHVAQTEPAASAEPTQ